MSPAMLSAVTTVFTLIAMVFGLLTARETEAILQKANVSERPKKVLHVVFGILVFLASAYCTVLLFQKP